MTAPKFRPELPIDAAARVAALQAAGFKRKRKGYRCGEVSFSAQPGWFILETPGKEKDNLAGNLGSPGLWKPMTSNSKQRQVFALPEFTLTQANPEIFNEPGQPSLQPCLEWALSTLRGEVPSGWQAPSGEDIESWQDTLTVQHRGVVRQLQIDREGGRFALRLRIVSGVPSDLPKASRRWLNHLLTDSQDQWRLARFGTLPCGSNHFDAWAEVDLTGAPAPGIQRLFLASVDTLKWIAASLVTTAEFLASDASAASQVLEIR